MDRITPVSKSRHRHVKVRRDKVDAINAEARMIPIVVSEFMKAATQYPILLTKNARTGKFLCVAMCGFDNGENLFWREGRWDAIYVPLNVVRQPFFLGARDDAGDGGGNEFTLCIDNESPCLDKTEGEPLFDDDGNETPYLREMQRRLQQLVIGERQTNILIDKLLEADLLTEVALDIAFANGEKSRVQGLYSIDEEKLDALDNASFLALRADGHLPLIYAMILSVPQIYALIQRKNAVSATAQQWFKPASGQ
ncbi:MAG: peptidase [Alphaproteobacteria bacterium]|nr:MAG: peptidase [Alphaproteobacteria bacterium]